MAVSLHLFLNNPDLSEGQFTEIIRPMINNGTLRAISLKHDLPRYMLQLTQHRRKWNVSLPARS